MSRVLSVVLSCVLVAASLLASAHAQDNLQILPADIQLSGNFAQLQLLVTKADANVAEDRRDDFTSQAKFESTNPAIVAIDAAGLLLARANGQANIVVSVGELKREVPVTVAGLVEHPPVKFSRDIRPIL